MQKEILKMRIDIIVDSLERALKQFSVIRDSLDERPNFLIKCLRRK